MTQKEKYRQLQTKAQEALEVRDNMRSSMELVYQRAEYAPKARQNQLERASKAFTKASDKFIDFVDEISPRNFRSGVPFYWIIRKLTYEDATTTGQLSEVPDVPYGYTLSDVRRFAAPLAKDRHGQPI